MILTTLPMEGDGAGRLGASTAMQHRGLSWCRLVCLLALGTSAGLALAADAAAPKDAMARYERERAACLKGNTPQDRATCLREAGAALQEARRGSTEASSSYDANALRRCETLPGSDRKDCIARMKRGSTSGSVAAGGIVREHVVRVPATPVSAPTPTPTPAPAKP